MKELNVSLHGGMARAVLLAAGGAVLIEWILLAASLVQGPLREPALQALWLACFISLLMAARWDSPPVYETLAASERWIARGRNVTAFVLGASLTAALGWRSQVSAGATAGSLLFWSAVIYAIALPVLLRSSGLWFFVAGQSLALGVGILVFGAHFLDVAIFLWIGNNLGFAVNTLRGRVTAASASLGASSHEIGAGRNVRKGASDPGGREANARSARALAEACDGLRQPARVLTRSIQSLAAMFHPAEARAAVLQVQAAADCMGGALQLLHEIAMVDSDRRLVRREPVALGRLASSVCAILAPRADAKGLTLSCSVGEDEVLADPGMLHSMLLNLVANAIQYTDGGTVRVASVASGGSVDLAVQDSGRGISEGDRARVYEPFFRGGNAGSQELGAGLGLALVHRLAAKGEIGLALDSKLGEGTTVTLTLPRLAARRRAASIRQLRRTTPSLAGCRALVVVASADLSAALQQDARLWDMQVREARSVYQMMTMLLEGYQPEVLIVSAPLDGGATGRDALASLRSVAQLATIPIVMLQLPSEDPIRVRQSDMNIRTVLLDATRTTARLRRALTEVLVHPGHEGPSDLAAKHTSPVSQRTRTCDKASDDAAVQAEAPGFEGRRAQR